jgi:YD repeat-containing protein
VVLALLGTLLLTLSPNQPPAQAATQIVFGPRTYERTTGPPNVFTEPFLLPTNVGPPFTLHIDNGLPDGTHRISSATLTLNGTEVVSPNEFSQRVAVIEKAVTLQPGTNTLVVRLASGPGRLIAVTITGILTAPPALAAVTPATGTVGQTVSVTLTGENTTFQAGLTEAAFGPNLAVGGGAPGDFGPVTVHTATSATATVAISATAALGPRAVTVKTGSEEVRKADAFTVRAPSPVAMAGTTVSPVAGSGTAGFADGAGPSAQFATPSGLARDATGALNVADTQNHRIRKITADGTVTTVAGTGTPGLFNGPALAAQFNSPEGLAVAADGTIYIADTHNHVIRQLTAAGTVSTLAGTGLAGYADGAGGSAQFDTPRSLTRRPDGTLVIGDEGNNRVRLLDPATGTVSTLAGSGTRGFADGPAATAQFASLAGVAANGGGIYVADTANQRIRKVASDGSVSTYAGTGAFGFLDGAASSAHFADPVGVALDAAGQLYVADAFNSLIRRITPAGQVETLAGTGERGGQDGAGTVATFRSPRALAADSAGQVFLADSGNHRIRVLRIAPRITAVTPTSAVHGTTVSPFTITGTDLPGATRLDFLLNGSPDPGITASALAVSTDGTSLTATVTLTTSAAVGPRTVAVTTPGGTSDATPSGATTFTVLGRITLIPDFQLLKADRTGTLTVSLSVPAPAGGVTVTLTSANSGVATVTSAVSIVAGATSGIASVNAVAEGEANLTASAQYFQPGFAVVRVSVLPPNPVTVAPPLDRTVATTIGAATDFLYTGSDPIQTGVVAGTIEARRAAVLRGRVLGRDGSALSGVTISILQHPEYGSTLSRADGYFDMAVNGGSQLTVRYAKAGFPPAQRSVTAPWQDYATLPDVVLIPYDPRVTAIDLTAPATIQAARGSPVTDADGSRQATVFFPQGTSASLIRPDGTTQPLTTLSVRATEYTVGPNGPTAMPAPLPPTSGYTYAVELSADEAVANGVKIGGKDLLLSQPIPFYVENFLNFPVGTRMPVGYYDNDRAAWVPSDNGRVVKVLAISAAVAELDISGSGVAADAAALAALGITDAERQQLASLYFPGQSLWRVPITHFSSWDANMAFGPRPGAQFPGQGPPLSDTLRDRPTVTCGSIIECQNQTLGEAVEIVGTPYRLHYRSDRVPGRQTASSLEIPLSGPSVPSVLKRIDLEIHVAGRLFPLTFPAAPNQSHTFTWDRQDAYGRTVQGAQPVLVRIGYVYDGVYQEPAQLTRSFGYYGSGMIAGSRTRQEVTLWQEHRSALGATWDAPPQGLGGWSLDQHHAYDAGGPVLYRGDGQRHSATDLGTVITTVAGGGTVGTDGGPATQAELIFPQGVAVDGQGTLFFSQRGGSVRQVSPTGIISTVVPGQGYNGDGIPASSARVNFPAQVAVDPQGHLYIADEGNNRIRKVDRQTGLITTVAGNGVGSTCGAEEVPATSTGVGAPVGVAVDGQGNLFLTDTWSVRKVSPDGRITTVAGQCGDTGFSGDNGPATAARLGTFPQGIAVDAQGNLFIADQRNQRIRKVDPSGIITTVAGSGPVGLGFGGYNGDHIPATAARLHEPAGVAVDAQGTLYIYDMRNHRIRQVSPTGIITTVAGTGAPGYNGDGRPALTATLDLVSAAGIPGLGVAVGPQAHLFLADLRNHRVRRLAPPLPGFSAGDLTLAAADGSVLYGFSPTGRHLRTLHALTGALLHQFAYDPAGRLSTLTDGDGNVTTVERDATTGAPTAIRAPDG